jgi:hypothetical protein
MATRSKSSAEKRRKEMARKEKQRSKNERRAARALEGPTGGPPIEERDDLDEFLMPLEDVDALEAMEPVGHPQPPGQAQRGGEST